MPRATADRYSLLGIDSRELQVVVLVVRVRAIDFLQTIALQSTDIVSNATSNPPCLVHRWLPIS